MNDLMKNMTKNQMNIGRTHYDKKTMYITNLNRGTIQSQPPHLWIFDNRDIAAKELMEADKKQTHHRKAVMEVASRKPLAENVSTSSS